MNFLSVCWQLNTTFMKEVVCGRHVTQNKWSSESCDSNSSMGCRDRGGNCLLGDDNDLAADPGSLGPGLMTCSLVRYFLVIAMF